jgi:hypothetical protein
MSRIRSAAGRAARWSATAAIAASLVGCASSKIKFTNVSDVWLNAWFYVGAAEADVQEGPNDLYRQRSIQVAPGGSASFRPPPGLVHLQVETVSPTWVPTGREHWLEVLTRPPVHIVASGRSDKLEFRSFEGEVAIIPDRERSGGRFAYHTAPEKCAPPTTTVPQPPAVTSASTAPDDRP